MELHSTRPYELSIDSAQGYYRFTTDSRLHYRCAFRECTNLISPLLGVYDIVINEFDFGHNKEGIEKGMADRRIAATITSLLKDVLVQQPNGLILFICADEGTTGRGRFQLFQRWYQAALSETCTAIPIEFALEDRIIYAGILVSKAFSHMEVLEHEMQNKALGIVMEKFEG